MPAFAGVARPPESDCEMPVRWSSAPGRSGSMPYAAGRPAVNKMTSAPGSAMQVAFTMAAFEGASAAMSFSSSVMSGGVNVSGDLVSDEKESDGHQNRVGDEGVAQ